MKETLNTVQTPLCTIPSVSGSITVYNGIRRTQKHIAISKEWATEEYYTIEDDGETLILTTEL